MSLSQTFLDPFEKLHLLLPTHPTQENPLANATHSSNSPTAVLAASSDSFVSSSPLCLLFLQTRLSVLLLLAVVICFFAGPFLRSILRQLQGYRWLFKGPEILARGYKYGRPYTVQSPERRYVVVSSASQVRELSNYLEKDFSLVEVAVEVFAPQHTMNGVEMTGLAMHRRLLRKMSLTLPTSTPVMQKLIEHALEIEIASSTSVTKDGWTTFSSIDMAMRLISRANAIMFCGQELANDPEFVKSALQYSNDVVLAAEAARLAPGWLKGLVAYAITKGHRSSKEVIAKLTPVLEARIANGGNSERQNDYLQGIIETVPEHVEDRPSKIISHLMALWFASIHQPAITLLFVLHDLCAHPEYIPLLRSEARDYSTSISLGKLSDLSLFDSFIKESTRMHTFETISLRRKAMHSQQLQDGTKVNAGDWVCVPQAAVMSDPTVFADPDTFDGFRFVKGHASPSAYTGTAHRLTDMHPDYLFWGLGKQSCPGRFYTSHILKLAVLHLVMNFEMTSQNPAPRTVNWRSMRVPLPSNTLSIRRLNAP